MQDESPEGMYTDTLTQSLSQLVTHSLTHSLTHKLTHTHTHTHTQPPRSAAVYIFLALSLRVTQFHFTVMYLAL